VGIPHRWRDFQARWESRLLDFSSGRLFHRPCLGTRHQLAQTGIATQSVRSVADTQGHIQVLVHQDIAAGRSGAPTDRLDLQDQILPGHGVVAMDRALVLHREDALQIATGAAGESGTALAGGNLEPSVELSPIVLAQKNRWLALRW